MTTRLTQEIFPVIAIIPSLNPDDKLLNTVTGLLDAGFTSIILIDDGSRKDCQHYFDTVAAMDGCTVLHHEVNRGKGRALKTAFRYYLDHFDLEQYIGVVTADADGQHLSKDIRRTADAMIEMQRKSSDFSAFDCMVLGTRDFNQENVPFKSRNGNKITTTVFQLLYGKRINDTQTGLRAISNHFLYMCGEIVGERFEYEIRMLIDAVISKISIYELPIETVYYDDNRETHFDPILDSIKIYKILLSRFLRFATSGLCSVLIDQGLFAILQKVVFSFLNAAVSIPVATVLARVASSVFNYCVNRKIVFQKKTGLKSVWRYYALCILQTAISGALVTAFYYLLHMDASILKLIVDTILFFISYRIQQAWVFEE